MKLDIRPSFPQIRLSLTVQTWMDIAHVRLASFNGHIHIELINEPDVIVCLLYDIARMYRIGSVLIRQDERWSNDFEYFKDGQPLNTGNVLKKQITFVIKCPSVCSEVISLLELYRACVPSMPEGPELNRIISELQKQVANFT